MDYTAKREKQKKGIKHRQKQMTTYSICTYISGPFIRRKGLLRV